MAERYILELERPKGVSITDMKQYIKDAVRSHAGGGDPDDPLWEMTQTQVKVSRGIEKKAFGGK